MGLRTPSVTLQGSSLRCFSARSKCVFWTEGRAGPKTTPPPPVFFELVVLESSSSLR